MRLWWDFESAIVLHQCNLKIQMHKNSPLYCIASRKTRDANAWLFWLPLPRLNKQRSKVPSDRGNQDLLFWQRWEEFYVWMQFSIHMRREKRRIFHSFFWSCRLHQVTTDFFSSGLRTRSPDPLVLPLSLWGQVLRRAGHRLHCVVDFVIHCLGVCHQLHWTVDYIESGVVSP